MADISKCGNGDRCPSRKSCYRWTVKPDEYRQSVSNFYQEGQTECIMYWPTNVEEAIANPPKDEAIKHDTGKPDMTYIPNSAMEEIARVFMFGHKKYDSENWAKGFNYRRPAAAALRHVFLWLSGEDVDAESGLTHLAHACCCLVMLIHFQKHGTGKDDRYKEKGKK